MSGSLVSDGTDLEAGSTAEPAEFVEIDSSDPDLAHDELRPPDTDASDEASAEMQSDDGDIPSRESEVDTTALPDATATATENSTSRKSGSRQPERVSARSAIVARTSANDPRGQEPPVKELMARWALEIAGLDDERTPADTDSDRPLPRQQKSAPVAASAAVSAPQPRVARPARRRPGKRRPPARTVPESGVVAARESVDSLAVEPENDVASAKPVESANPVEIADAVETANPVETADAVEAREQDVEPEVVTAAVITDDEEATEEIAETPSPELGDDTAESADEPDVDVDVDVDAETVDEPAVDAGAVDEAETEADAVEEPAVDAEAVNEAEAETAGASAAETITTEVDTAETAGTEPGTTDADADTAEAVAANPVEAGVSNEEIALDDDARASDGHSDAAAVDNDAAAVEDDAAAVSDDELAPRRKRFAAVPQWLAAAVLVVLFAVGTIAGVTAPLRSEATAITPGSPGTAQDDGTQQTPTPAPTQTPELVIPLTPTDGDVPALVPPVTLIPSDGSAAQGNQQSPATGQSGQGQTGAAPTGTSQGGNSPDDDDVPGTPTDPVDETITPPVGPGGGGEEPTGGDDGGGEDPVDADGVDGGPFGG